MARRVKEISIPGDPKVNRDAGKTYIITEMPASQAERWANRAIIAVGNSGAKVDHVEGSGVNGLAILGLKALFGINEPAALDLLDEMMGCVTIKEQYAPAGRTLVEDDIEEVSTRMLLKSEVFSLHTGFSWAELQLMLSSAMKAVDSSNILNTSPAPSGSSSPKDEPLSSNLTPTSGSETSTI